MLFFFFSKQIYNILLSFFLSLLPFILIFFLHFLLFPPLSSIIFIYFLLFPLFLSIPYFYFPLLPLFSRFFPFMIIYFHCFPSILRCYFNLLIFFSSIFISFPYSPSNLLFSINSLSILSIYYYLFSLFSFISLCFSYSPLFFIFPLLFFIPLYSPFIHLLSSPLLPPSLSLQPLDSALHFSLYSFYSRLFFHPSSPIVFILLYSSPLSSSTPSLPFYLTPRLCSPLRSCVRACVNDGAMYLSVPFITNQQSLSLNNTTLKSAPRWLERPNANIC